MHDKKTWLQMEQIEQALGKRIIRIETKNLDEMEEVRVATLHTQEADSPMRIDYEKGSEIVVYLRSFVFFFGMW